MNPELGLATTPIEERWGLHAVEYPEGDVRRDVLYEVDNGRLPPTLFQAIGEEPAWGGYGADYYKDVHPLRLIGILTSWDGSQYECSIHPDQLTAISE